MPNYERDLGQLLELTTMTFKNVPDIDGDTTDENGAPRVWKILPLTIEREEAAEAARAKNTDYMQRMLAYHARRWQAVERGQNPEDMPESAPETASDEEALNPRATARQYAPIVAALVAEPKLDAEYLEQNFHGVYLKLIADEAQVFFQELQGRFKENREARRKNR